MKILILTNHSDKIADLNALTAPNKQAYADRHGYTFENINHPYEKHVEWLELLWNRILTYDVVMTMGCDTIFTNMRKRVEDMVFDGSTFRNELVPDERVIIAREQISWWPINNDVMIWPKGEVADLLIARLIFDSPKWLNYPWLWQAHLWDLMQQKAVYRENVIRIVESREMNSTFQPFINANGLHRLPGPSSWQLGDWILHALDLPHETRLEVIKWGLQFAGDALYAELSDEVTRIKSLNKA